MDIDLQEAYRSIMEAVRAEDIFGSLPRSSKKPIVLLDEKYNELSLLVKPENYSAPDDKESAFDAKERLDRFYSVARERVKDGNYGILQRSMTIRPGQPIIETDKRKYHLGFPIAEGTISTVFDGQCSVQDDFAGRVAIKIVNSAEDNELMWREARVLQLLRSQDGAQRKHLPILHDKFRTEDNRVGLIFGFLDQSYDLVTIRENPNHLKGVDQKHVAWIMNRALSAIGYAHYNGVVHGNIEPSHLIVRPYDHNLFVVDWSWAAISPVNTGDRYQIFTENYSAPEVQQGKSPAPTADLYSLGKCMIYLLGGNVENNDMPEHIEEELREFLLKFVSTSETRRPQDAWHMHGQLHQLVIKLWGKKKFQIFPM